MSKLNFKDWVIKKYAKEYNCIADIASIGCVNGFPGLTDYSDTTKIYKKFRKDIWKILQDTADSWGEDVLTMIANFGGAKDVETDMTFENLLARATVEIIAQEYIREKEEEQEND